MMECYAVSLLPTVIEYINSLGSKSCSALIPELKEGKYIQNVSAVLWNQVALIKGQRIALYSFHVLGKNSVAAVSDKWDQILDVGTSSEMEQLTKSSQLFRSLSIPKWMPEFTYKESYLAFIIWVKEVI